MFITVHSAIGIAAVSALSLQNPVAALVVGWLLHYVCDVVPHGDEQLGVWCWSGARPVRRLGLIFILDFCLILLGLWGLHFLTNLTGVILMAVLGSIIPDVLLGTEIVLGRRTFSCFSRFHNAVHRFTGITHPLFYGFLFQVGLLILMFVAIRHLLL
ncbi:hypothetical protein KKC47_02965 [Patescibacteria group bacterium]|nr:hypothetical protein [Patescibacteria group bacterium]